MSQTCAALTISRAAALTPLLTWKTGHSARSCSLHWSFAMTQATGGPMKAEQSENELLPVNWEEYGNFLRLYSMIRDEYDLYVCHPIVTDKFNGRPMRIFGAIIEPIDRSAK
jgi:hypothetical protein